MATDTLLKSPKLAALELELETGNGLVLARFWAEVSTLGSPLIEVIPDDEQHVLVTFLWRELEPIDNVAVFGWIFTYVTENQMTRLHDTDVWYRTYRLPADLRATYTFVPDSSLIPDDFDGHHAKEVTDPLNPGRYVAPQNVYDPGGKELAWSVLELPAAPPQSWSVPQPDGASGLVVTTQVRSDIIGEYYSMYVYTPPRFESLSERPGLLILFDGWLYRETIPTPSILDNLINAGRIPPLVALLLDTPKRNRDLCCSPPFGDFLSQELVPWARQRYHVTTDPEQTIVAGSSYGGLAATYSALRSPELFGKVLSQTGAFGWSPQGESEPEWLARQVASASRVPRHVYLDVGRLETISIDPQAPNPVTVNRHMRNLLRAKGCTVQYAEYQGSHEFLCWRGTLADGLLALLGEKPVPS